MFNFKVCNLFVTFLTITFGTSLMNGYYIATNVECGPHGFVCERNRMRLCGGANFLGPAFLCPVGTMCNEESTNVCDNPINYIDPELTRSLRCRRHERIADPTVAGCKGYILCVPNGNRFQGIKFKCAGNTIFNGYSRTCSSPQKYKCSVGNTTKATPELFPADHRKYIIHNDFTGNVHVSPRPTSIECKNYKLRITQDESPAQATYFCPSRPINGELRVRCTIFSNQFCVTLERDHDDQFSNEYSPAYRRPRM